MKAAQSNHFQFAHAAKATGMTVLNAVMSDFSFAKHAHKDLALGVTLAGVQEFLCNGATFRSRPGHIIVLNPDDVHNGNPGQGTPLEYTMLYLDPVQFQPILASASTREDIMVRMPETNFVDEPLRDLILHMSQLVATSRTATFEYEHGLYQIARHLTKRQGMYQPDAWKETKDALLLRARDYIHDNVEDDISVEDLSRVANISKFHFIRMFRQQFGLTPHQYILNHKVNMVQRALTTGAPPSDIAHRFGFFDVSHLNRHFKRAYGITPKQFQQQARL